MADEEDVGDFHLDDVDEKLYLGKDFTLKVADSLPGPLGNWLSSGDRGVRIKKLFLLLGLLVLICLLVFGVIVSITLLVQVSDGDSSGDSSDGNGDNGVDDDYMLPDWASPSSYSITLVPDLITFELTGTVILRFTV